MKSFFGGLICAVFVGLVASVMTCCSNASGGDSSITNPSNQNEQNGGATGTGGENANGDGPENNNSGNGANNDNKRFYEIGEYEYNYTNNVLTSYRIAENIDYKKTEDGSLEYKTQCSWYDEKGQVTIFSDSKTVKKDNNRIYNDATVYYSYESVGKKIDYIVKTSSTDITDPEIHQIINSSSVTTVEQNGETSVSNYSSSGTKSFIRMEDGQKVYKYIKDDSNDFTLIFVDEEDFRTKDIFYDNNGNVVRTILYKHLTNCPNDLKNYSWSPSNQSEISSYYDYCNERFNVLVNTENEYKYEIVKEFRYKNDDKIYILKDIYHYKLLSL